jgi:hypothetical protein
LLDYTLYPGSDPGGGSIFGDVGETIFGKTYDPKQFQFDPSAFSTGRGGRQLQAWLEQRARGGGPSLAQGVMQRGLEQAIKNQRAQTAGMMGTNPALAAKLGGEQGAGMMQAGMREAGMVGLQEQAQAQAALAQWLQQERQAQMQQQAMQAGQHNLYQQMMMQQAAQDQGLFGPLMNLGGSMLGAGIGAGWFGGGGGGGQSSFAGAPQWSDYGF